MLRPRRPPPFCLFVMSEVTPAVTRGSARTPNGSSVEMSPAGMAKLQRMKDEIEREEAEAAACRCKVSGIANSYNRYISLTV